MNVNAILKELSVHFQGHKDTTDQMSRTDRKIVQSLISILSDNINDVYEEKLLDVNDKEFNIEDDVAQMSKMQEKRTYTADQMKDIVKMKFELMQRFLQLKIDIAN